MNYKHLVTCHDVLVPWNETPSQHTMTLSLWPRSQNPTERTQILWARGTTWRLFRGPPPGQSSLIHAIICHNETQRERERGREGDRDWLLLIRCPRISENAMKHWLGCLGGLGAFAHASVLCGLASDGAFSVLAGPHDSRSAFTNHASFSTFGCKPGVCKGVVSVVVLVSRLWVKPPGCKIGAWYWGWGETDSCSDVAIYL